MATTMKKTTKKAEDVTVEEVNETVEETSKKIVEETSKKTVKKYSQTEGIPCRSITHGNLFVEGIKSHIVYEWADNGDITEVEYQDLVAAIRSNANYISKPYFIIEDEDLVSQFAQVKKVYESMYSVKDLTDVLHMPVNQMVKTIKSLPEGAKEAIKHHASSMISKGTLDSVKAIKALDEIFDTNLMLMTELFN